jgi:Mn2+/Fe2+ NRAMP family transporter
VTFQRFLERKFPSRERAGSPEDRGRILPWPPPDEPPKGLSQRVSRLWPGIVTGAADVDPALVLTATVAGAAWGLSLLWVVPLCIPFLITIFAVSARIGHQTQQGLVDLLRQHYGRGLAMFCALVIIVINMAMITADLLAVSDALSVILLQRRIFFVAPLAFGIWYILIFRDYYRITHALVWLSLPLFAYVAAGVLAISDVREVLLRTFVPKVGRDPGFLTTLVALFGSLLTPYVLVWQTSSRREQALLGEREPYGPGHHAGGLVTALISFFVLLTAAEVLHTGGLATGDINFRQAANALLPLGEIGPVLFSLGIVGAGMVALPVLIASMCYSVAEAMGWRSGLSEQPWEAKRFYVLISIAVFVAAAANFFRINPVGALYWSQVLAGVLTVPILLFILLLSNDRRIMRTTNSAWQNFWIGAAVGGLISAAFVVLWWKIFRS